MIATTNQREGELRRWPPRAGETDTALSEQLFAEAHRFDFFQAVRLLERMAAERAAAETRPAAVARWARTIAPRQEAVRFRALPSHSFPPGPISEFAAAAAGDRRPTRPAGNGHGVPGADRPQRRPAARTTPRC